MVRYRAFSISQSTAWERSAPKFRKSKTGAAAKTYHPSRSEGSIPVGSTRGILKGGTIRAGASYPPLEPASLLTFLPEQESKAAGGQCPLTISHGGFLRIVLSLTRPVSLLRCSRCLGQSPPCQRGVVWRSQTGGILQGGRFPHRFVLLGKCLLWNPSVTAYAVPAPFNKGAFFIRYRYCGAWLGIDNHQQVPSHQQTGTAPPAGSLRHGYAVPAPSRRELWGLCLATLDFLRMRSACCESLRQKSKIFASSL